LHSTNGLPLHLMLILKQAFDMSSPKFMELLKTLSPDLLIYDILQLWAPAATASLEIPSVVFITTSVAASMYHFHLNAPKDDVVFPYGDTIYYHKHKNVKVATSAKDKEEDIVTQCVAGSSSIVLIKSFREIEGKYADHLSLLTDKKIVPVGPLVADPYCPDTEQNTMIMEWLDTKAIGSTVFVSFGSEYFLSSGDLEEIAFGLEMSNVNFIWVLRFPKTDREIDLSEALPGFLEMVKNKGLVVKVLEAMKFGVPIVVMPMHLDQPINAWLVAEVGVGLEVVREEGRLLRKNVAIQQVVVGELGVAVKVKANNLHDILEKKRNKEIRVSTGSGGVIEKKVRKMEFGTRFGMAPEFSGVAKRPPPASHLPPKRMLKTKF
ncbi:hypothetical protein Tco_1454077, partial [Tanacetum coccineum]